MVDGHDAEPLLEREAELARLNVLLERPRAGEAGVVLVQGSAGAGKTRLVQEGTRRAASLGLQVLRARGSELERDFPFSVVRQLLEPAVHGLPADARAEVFTGAATLAGPVLEPASPAAEIESDPLPALHGLYWLMANLAERAPSVVVVDDLHWADVSSLRWLHYLIRRLEGLPLALILAARDKEPGPGAHVLGALRGDPLVELVVPKPLSAAAAALLVERRLSSTPDPEFTAACTVASGGNPFLLRELLAALAADGVEPTEAEADRVRSYGPETISRAVLLRVARFPSEVGAVARAVAVLGPGARVTDIAELAGVDRDAVEHALECLIEADVLSSRVPLDFIHPVVRAAIYAELTPAARSRAHARAARLLDASGAPSEEIAAHLTATEGDGDPWTVEQLRRAASAALARGAPDSAAAALRRAAAEPPPRPERAGVLLELALAYAGASAARAFEAFSRAFDESTDDLERATIALEWGRALHPTGAMRDAATIFERGTRIAERAGLEELRQKLEGQLLASALMDCSSSLTALGTLAHRSDALRDPDADAMLLAAAAMGATWRGDDRSAATDFAQRALGAISEPGPDAVAVALFSAFSLRCADQFEAAAAIWDLMLPELQRAGVKVAVGAASCFRGDLFALRGSLKHGEADLWTAHEIATEQSFDWGLAWVAAFLVEILVDRGHLDAAADIAGGIPVSGVESRFVTNLFICSRARLLQEQGRPKEALEDLQAAGQRLEEAGIRNPGAAPWRSLGARAALALGEREQAIELAREEVERARQWGAPRPLAAALRAWGLAETGDRRLELLREACAVVDGSSAELERARATNVLGLALRRAGRRREAQNQLRQALDVASRCGADALAERAREELKAVGARPRRDRISGSEALTASELRVAELAAAGQTNREIAQALFVTQKTVETHLGRAYAKLEISGRVELPGALADGASDPAPAAPPTR